MIGRLIKLAILALVIYVVFVVTLPFVVIGVTQAILIPRQERARLAEVKLDAECVKMGVELLPGWHWDNVEPCRSNITARLKNGELK